MAKKIIGKNNFGVYKIKNTFTAYAPNGRVDGFKTSKEAMKAYSKMIGMK